MMKPLIFASLGLATFTTSAGELRFAPEADLTLKKSVTVTRETTTDTCDFSIDDQEFPIKTGLRHTSTFELVVEDTYVKVEDARVQELSRSFERVQRAHEYKDVPENVSVQVESDDTDPMEGLAVRFTWNEEEEEYDRKFEDDSEETDEAWLEGLIVDFDFQDFLPDDEVELEGSWSIEAAAFLSALNPGGDWSWDSDDEEDDGDDGTVRIFLPGAPDEVLREALEGDVTATFVELEGDLATIEIEVELEAELELVTELDEQFADEDDAERSFSEADGTLGYEGKGTLVWNVKRGTFETLEFELDVERSLSATWTNSKVVDGEVDLELYSEDSGVLNLSATAGA